MARHLAHSRVSQYHQMDGASRLKKAGHFGWKLMRSSNFAESKLEKNCVSIDRILKTGGGTKHFEEIPKVEGARNFLAYWENWRVRNISRFLETGVRNIFGLSKRGVRNIFSRPIKFHPTGYAE